MKSNLIWYGSSDREAWLVLKGVAYIKETVTDVLFTLIDEIWTVSDTQDGQE